MHYGALVESSCDAQTPGDVRCLCQVERTYTGPQTGSEDIVEHMKSCNPRGPLVIQVAKLFPKSDVSSFGRSLSMSLQLMPLVA